MKKRLVALALGMALVVSSFTACGNTAEAPADKAVEKEEVKEEAKEDVKEEETAKTEGIPADYFAGTELDIAIVRRSGDEVEDFNTKAVIPAVEEATGIHINWTVIDSAVANERISTMLASGDLPDAFLGLIGSDTIANNMDMFYNLSEGDLLETYAPKILEDYENGGQNALDIITWPDGSIRSLVTNMGSSYHTEGNGILLVNQDWLDAVGKEIPTTDEEFYEVLCAFRDQDANGNGDPTDEIPLSFCHNDWIGWFMQFANSWGIAGRASENKEHYYMLKNGKIESTVDTQAYREFLEYFHKLADEGLLDVEGFSQTLEQYDTKQAENRVGIMFEWTPPAGLNYVPMRPFEVDGYEVIKTGGKNYFYGNATGFVAAADCSNIEALLHWFNYMHTSSELKYMARYGQEGHAWYWTEEGLGNTYSSDNKPADLDPNIDYVLQEHLGNSAAPYLMPSEVVVTENFRKGMVDLVYDLIPEEYVLPKMVDPAAVEERTFIESDLFELIGNFMATSVIDGVTDESWETYLDDLKTYQYYEWLDWWQQYVDGEI